MSDSPGTELLPGAALLEAYDHLLPVVYGYLRSRCDDRALAEDLTAETFFAAVERIRRQPTIEPTTAWLIGIARHKLIDTWRRSEREARGLRSVPGGFESSADPWDAQLDLMRSRDVLAALGPHHRAALTLRYLDDLPVPAVADLLGRSVHATEALLVRARAAFRHAYEQSDDEGASDA